MRAPFGRLTIAVGLLLAALGTRFPFFFEAVISWDESTFVLLGQDLLDGGLPYVGLWDLKPPLAFAAYAAAIALLDFGVPGIRLAGTLCVFAIALAVVVAGCRSVSRSRAVVVAVVTVLGIGVASEGQATLTEHFATVPLCWAVVKLMRQPVDTRSLVAVGLLLSVAALIRTNLAYVALAVVLALLVRPGKRSVTGRLADVVALGAGAVIPLVVCIVPYWLAGELDVLYRSAISAPLAYSTTQLSVMESIDKLVDSIVRPKRIIVLLTFSAGLIGLAKMAWKLKLWQPRFESEYWQVTVIASATLSVVLSGGGHSHYLIQLIPLYALATFAVRPPGLLRGSVAGWATGAALTLAVATSLVPVGHAYNSLVERLWLGQSVSSGRALAVADFLRLHNPEHDPVFLAEDHIAYWLTGTRPLTRMSAHPSNIAKDSLIEIVEGEGADSASELRKIFEVRPMFVVMSPRPWYLDAKPDLLEWLDRRIDREYELATQIDGLNIYRRAVD